MFSLYQVGASTFHMFAQPSWPQIIYGTYWKKKKQKMAKDLRIQWSILAVHKRFNKVSGIHRGVLVTGNFLPMAHVNGRWLLPKPWLQLFKWVVSTWATAAKVKAPDFSTCCKRGALRFERFFLEMDGRWCEKMIQNKGRLKRRCWTCLWIYFNFSRNTEHR